MRKRCVKSDSMLLEEIRHIAHRLGERLRLGQHDDAEAQILVPVKPAAGDDEHMLLMQELHREVVRILKIKLALVQPREQVERRMVGHIIHAVDLIQRFERRLALLKEAAARHEHLVRALAVHQRRRDDQLRQRVAAQAHGGELHHAVLHRVQRFQEEIIVDGL